MIIGYFGDDGHKTSEMGRSGMARRMSREGL